MAVGRARGPARPARGVAARAGRAGPGGVLPRRLAPRADATRLARAPAPPARSSLAALGLAAGALALARPQHGTLREDVTTQGVDIVVALDVSGTMAAQDFQPRNRLEVAKEVVAEFVKRRTSDRVGLVVFAGRSLTKSPAHHRHRRAPPPARRRAARDAPRRHGHRLRPRHRAHPPAPVAGEEPGRRARDRRRQQRRRDRPRHRGGHGEGHGGARLHDPRGTGRPGADARPRPRPLHRRGGDRDRDGRREGQPRAAAADRRADGRRVLPGRGSRRRCGRSSIASTGSRSPRSRWPPTGATASSSRPSSP